MISVWVSLTSAIKRFWLGSWIALCFFCFVSSKSWKRFAFFVRVTLYLYEILLVWINLTKVKMF